jgi:hypothetical protein
LGVEEMIIRRLLAVAVLLIPAGLGLWSDATMKTHELTLAFSAPRYADITPEQMATLPKEQLATMVTSAHGTFKEMDALWRMTLENYEVVSSILIGVMGFFALVIAAVLWRSTPNKALQSDGSRPAGETRR